jgi:DNA-binding winged helix-turn-helix (wHTH) protein
LIYRFANFALDTELLELRSAQGLVKAEPQVFSLLVYLIENRSHVVSKEELIEGVWDGRIVAKGVEFIQEPVARFGGVDANFRDPSGNAWKMIEARS